MRRSGPHAVRIELAAALIAAIAACAATRAAADAGDAPAPPAVRALQLNGNRPKLDGRLDDSAWESAEYLSGFTQKDPAEGTPSLDETRVAFLYDDRALYIGARMRCADPKAIRSTLARRDGSGNSERLIVVLDTYHDRRTAYSFSVTASGVRTDYYHPSDQESDRDYSFDPVWEVRTATDDTGWTAEMRIPFSQLRFSAADAQTWGLNLNRWTPTRNEDSYWVLIPKSATGWASRFGELRGIEGIEPSRRIELYPYVSSDASYRNSGDPDDPFADPNQYRSRVGSDLKMGLGPSLTLEATVNPDFGQVEADPAEVNLSAFETFFSEQRPFFTEGARLLQGNGPGYFYSRRIGAPPRGATSGDYEDRPSTTTILGAAKLSGRLASGTSLAALTALTAREHAKTYDATTGAFGEEEVAPVAGYGAMHVQQEFGPHASTAGLTMTTVRRDVAPGEPLAAIMTRQAITGGGDWNLRFRGGDYVLRGFVGGSHVEGDSAAIIRLQRSSARYFQRPDADYVTLDSSSTSMSGFTSSLNFEKNGGTHWLWGSGATVESPGYELNDAGRLSNSDDIDAWSSLTYRQNTPGRVFRSYNASVTPVAGWNFGGVRTYGGIDAESNWNWNNYMRTAVEVEAFAKAQSDAFTRGGPLMEDPATLTMSVGHFSNFAQNTQWSVESTYSVDESGGFGKHAGAGWSCQPGGSWKISFTPRYDRSHNPQMFIDAIEGGPAATFGARYVFSRLDRSTLAAQVRLNHAFTPDLSLEIYAEPFAASGRFHDYGDLVAARTRTIRRYGTGGTTIVRNEDGSRTVTDGATSFTLDDEDFNRLSFRSNVVLRWEWRRGSTFFFVWQQNREANEANGSLVSTGDLLDSFSADGENFVAAKISYWLPVD